MHLLRVALVLAVAAGCQRHDPAGSGQGSGSGSAGPDCALAIMRVQEAVQPQIDAAGSDSKITIMKMLPVMERACVEDHWPAALVQCITAVKPGDQKAVDKCNAQMPSDLQYKLQWRLTQLLPKPSGHPAQGGTPPTAAPTQP